VTQQQLIAQQAERAFPVLEQTTATLTWCAARMIITKHEAEKIERLLSTLPAFVHSGQLPQNEGSVCCSKYGDELIEGLLLSTTNTGNMVINEEALTKLYEKGEKKRSAFMGEKENGEKLSANEQSRQQRTQRRRKRRSSRIASGRSRRRTRSCERRTASGRLKT
jgi:hypothetical protein